MQQPGLSTIRCPGCGAIAQWGAPRCPNCGVPFVAPPGGFREAPSAPLPRQGVNWVLWAALLGLGLLAGLGIFAFSSRSSSSGRPTSTLSISAPKPAEEESSSGIFKVTQQAEKEPVIALTNGSSHPLRLELMDTYGRVQTQWFPAGETRSITISPGDYRADIEAPDDPSIQGAQGEVKVLEFHRYQADFVVGPALSNEPFYIGD